MCTTIKIELDDTVKDNVFFQKLESITINQTELFKYGINVIEVPDHIKDSDFDYLQSKVPHLESLYSDFMSFSSESITNLSLDDRTQKSISEISGIALGLKYSVELLQTNPNKFKKIGIPKNGKYLDYSIIIDDKKFEIETKGTTQKTYSKFKNDILSKKENQNSNPVHLRFGTIAMINRKDRSVNSKCVIVDDPPENVLVKKDDTFITQLYNYGNLLSFIIDSKNYNKYIALLRKNKINKVKINQKKFYGQYQYLGKTYFGECFDYRLIRENLDNLVIDKTNINFDKYTKKCGNVKFFIGIEDVVITAINKKNHDFLKTYISQTYYSKDEMSTHFIDKDGIIVVKSIDGDDIQLEGLFPEEEVINRLKLFKSYINENPHKCGAPCKSRWIKGKPCEKMTYRKYCHFHR